MRTARNQKEFDEIVTSGEGVRVESGYFVARENSRVEAWGNSRALFWKRLMAC